jgi:hypothetical protein
LSYWPYKIIGLIGLRAMGEKVNTTRQIRPGRVNKFLAAELYPVDLRSRLSGVSNCLANLYIFLAIKSFPTFQNVFTPHGAYWFYASVGRGLARLVLRSCG